LIVWSPDSKKLVAYRVRPGYHRKINYVESSPADQWQPKYMTIEYAKPGAPLALEPKLLIYITRVLISGNEVRTDAS
jgi:Dipeptidyl peptidase IV (DPP IV) N-terminal region